MGEAMRRREFIAFVGGTCSHQGQSVDPDPKPDMGRLSGANLWLYDGNPEHRCVQHLGETELGIKI